MSWLTRRGFLRASGAALALPTLETLAPRVARAAEAAPARLVFVFVPNGVHRPAWRPLTPSALGAGGFGAALAGSQELHLSPTLAPLQPFQRQLLVFSGLTLDGGRAHGDGPGDHARSAGSFLTAAHPVKTAGANIRAGVSVDQVAAQRLGRATRFASLELGTEPGRLAGSCDSGYSCAYSSTIVWRTPTQPLPHEVSPRLVFERLCGDPDAPPLDPETAARRARQRRSVLDLVREEARALQGQLSRSDRARLEEYLEGTRELERRLEEAERGEERLELPDPPPRGVPRDLGQHARLLGDLVALALQGDQTRVVTLMLGNAGSNRSYRELDAPEGHHDLSHHGKDPRKQEKLARINRYHVELLAHLLGRLAAAREGDGALLDRTLVLYGSGLGDGDRHDHEDLPVLLAGGSGLGVRGGRHLVHPADTPLANLHLALLQRAGVAVRSFGDATGPLGLG